MAENQFIYKPVISFTTPLQGGLQEGKSIFVTGRVLQETTRFSVNLLSGADNVLHVNPRYDDGPANVVFNTLENNIWGREERIANSPFLKGQPFNLEINVTEKAYKISLNGKSLKDYEHRLPFTRVDRLRVSGMVELDFVAYQNHAMPLHKNLLHDGLQTGKELVFCGIPNHDWKRIEFNLRHRFGIAFHYQCRFEENVVVRNTYEKGNWEAEERSADIPFKPGQFFQVKISCNRDQYNVFVNDRQTHTFKHRFTTLEDIDVFEVVGDLQLFSVKV